MERANRWGDSMLNEMYLDNKEDPISLDTILLFNLKDTLQTYEEKIFAALFKRDYTTCETLLNDFCLTMLELPEKEQLFTVRIFFISMITDILRLQIYKGELHPDALTHAYEIIYEIEQWSNISECMLHISPMMQRLTTYVISDHLIFRGNKYVEKALLLIHEHLKCKELSVNWLANKLNISATHLTNLFKQYFHVTASTYIEQKRIATIMYELTHTKQTLKEIREAFGFTSHSYFIQYFKKHTGLTPLQYVQQHHTLHHKK